MKTCYQKFLDAKMNNPELKDKLLIRKRIDFSDVVEHMNDNLEELKSKEENSKKELVQH